MHSNYYRIIISSILFVPFLVHGAITWDDPSNQDTGTIPKILGQHTLFVTQEIDVFAGHSIWDCNSDPNQVYLEVHNIPPLVGPGSPNPDGYHYICGWSPGEVTERKNVCDNYGSEQADPTCVNKTCTAAEIASASGCTDVVCAMSQFCNDNAARTTHSHYSRIGSTKTTNLKYLVDGVPFISSAAYGYAANNQCNPGTPDVPMSSLKVKITRNKGYKWDNENPICVREGTHSGALDFGNDFIDDSVLRDYINSNSGTQDTTLVYKYPIATPELERIYTGIWTNRDVIGKGKCSDNHSGCDPSFSGTFYSSPLRHLQSSFAPNVSFFDIAKNTNASPSCPTRIHKLSGLVRKCNFIIDPVVLSGAINDSGVGEMWFNGLSESDQSFLTGQIANPTPGTNVLFNTHIKRLRALSMNGDDSLSAALEDNPLRHDRLYTFVPNSCTYTYSYDPDNYPLIDRIKPTIEVTAQIGSGLTNPDLLFKQEGTTTVGIPSINSTTGSYLAGTGNITITLTDSDSSTFSAYPAGFNGISGIANLSIDICRTKTYTGFVLNTDCSNPSDGTVRPYLIYSTGETITSQYNPSGIITSPHSFIYSIDLEDTMPEGIQVAGEYQVYTAIIDRAGNINTGSVIFTIVPEGFDFNRTQFVKYDDIDDELNPIYTVSGSILDIDPDILEISSYANAQDAQTYKLSIFDKYNNPVYDWNLYEFGITSTGIYLDQVDKVGPSAIFAKINGNSPSNIPQTGLTNQDGALKFHLVSYAPGNFMEQFQFSYKNWDRFRNEIGGLNYRIFPNSDNAQLSRYYHILKGSVDLYTTNRIDLGTANDVLMSFFTTSAKSIDNLTSFTVSNFLESIESMSPNDFVITRTGSYSPSFFFDSFYPNPEYLTGATGYFTPEQKGSMNEGFTSDLRIKAAPYITLAFSGQTTRYYVSNTEDFFGSGILYQSGVLNRIYVEGLTSKVGKNGYVEAKDNIEINSAETRNAINKNVALLIRNRKPGGIVNRVKYLTGDVQSSDLVDINQWDTLIIKGGNLIFGDTYTETVTDPTYIPYSSRNYFFNSGSIGLESVLHKGIIVLKNEDGVGGNIYIKPDVRFIGATLFADESIESVRYNKTTFSVSNSARTFLLDKQLIIYGSLFSKNTIGGAVYANQNGRYTLPWQSHTASLDDAVRYDLAFLRMDNIGSDGVPNLNRGHNEFVVILSDPRNTSNPLPGFSKKLNK